MLLAVFANLPLLYVLFHTTSLYEGHRVRYHFARHRWRTTRIQNIEHQRRLAVIASESSPSTFEAKLAELTLKHQQRVVRLRRLPLETDERDYLIELETARFTESVRALTDP